MSASKAIGIVLGFFALTAANSLLRGYVLTVLWGWFIVPTFHLPQLSLAAAIGVALVVHFTTHQVDIKNDGFEWGERIQRVFLWVVLMPVAALSLGWVIHLFM